MKRSIWKSIRMSVVLYGVVSFFLAVLTELFLWGCFYALEQVFGVCKKCANHAGFMKRFYYWIRYANVSITKRGLYINDIGMFFFVLLIIYITGTVFFVLYFLLFTRKMTRDLSYISTSTRKIVEGRFEEKLELNRQDEIGEIASSINQMSEETRRLMEAERQAVQENRNLITCIAHDLRTPITSVIGYLQLAVDTEKYSLEERQKFAHIAIDKANRLEKLAQELFSYSRLMSGEMKIQRVDIDIVKLVEQMLEEFYPLFKEHGLECSVKQNKESIILFVDGGLIARAVQNLLSNAVKFGEEGKRIDIAIYERKDQVEISVTNYGKEIPKESQGHLFDRFYRVEESRSRDTGGTGLGLNIAEEIMSLHGGSIKAESNEKRTVFTLILPVNTKGDRQA